MLCLKGSTNQKRDHLLEGFGAVRRKRFSGEDKAENAQGRCRGVGGDMAKVDTKVGARVQPVS